MSYQEGNEGLRSTILGLSEEMDETTADMLMRRYCTGGKVETSAGSAAVSQAFDRRPMQIIQPIRQIALLERPVDYISDF